MTKPSIDKDVFYWQGHRGARGLSPENSIPAFLKALDYGLNALECDVVISKDKKVIVSHEPYFHHAYCSNPDGSPVVEKKSEDINMYQMTVEEIQAYDCGKRQNKKYPRQEPEACSKPTLKEMVQTVEAYCTSKNIKKPSYSIEIKSEEKGYGKYFPQPEEYAQLVLDEINELGIYDRANVMAFDLNILKALRKLDQEIVLTILVDNIKGVNKNLEMLGFVPQFYGPYFKLLSQKSIALIHEKGMKTVPWTVNEKKQMVKLIQIGVDGLTTDYPDVLMEVKKELEAEQ